MKTGNFLRKAIIGVLSAGSTLLIAACYGVYDRFDVARGYVKDADGNPIPNIKVCAQHPEYGEECSITYEDGYYFINSDINEESYNAQGFVICATDTDGAMNGDFEQRCVNIPAGTELPLDLNLPMDPVIEE